MPSPSLPTPLAIASTLSYAWGGIMLAISAVVSISSAAQGANVGVMAVPAALSIASGVAAHALRRVRWPFFALGACAAWVSYLGLVRVKLSLPGIVVNVVILVIVLAHLRRFK